MLINNDEEVQYFQVLQSYISYVFKERKSYRILETNQYFWIQEMISTSILSMLRSYLFTVT